MRKKKKKKKIRLVVVDSIAFHFRHEISDMAKRARILSQLAQDLNRLANERGHFDREPGDNKIFEPKRDPRPGVGRELVACGDEPCRAVLERAGAHGSALQIPLHACACSGVCHQRRGFEGCARWWW